MKRLSMFIMSLLLVFSFGFAIPFLPSGNIDMEGIFHVNRVLNITTSGNNSSSYIGNYTHWVGLMFLDDLRVRNVNVSTISVGTVNVTDGTVTNLVVTNVTLGGNRTGWFGNESTWLGRLLAENVSLVILNGTSTTFITANITRGTMGILNATTGTIVVINSTSGTITTFNATDATIGTLIGTDFVTRNITLLDSNKTAFIGNETRWLGKLYSEVVSLLTLNGTSTTFITINGTRGTIGVFNATSGTIGVFNATDSTISTLLATSLRFQNATLLAGNKTAFMGNETVWLGKLYSEVISLEQFNASRGTSTSFNSSLATIVYLVAADIDTTNITATTNVTAFVGNESRWLGKLYSQSIAAEILNLTDMTATTINGTRGTIGVFNATTGTIGVLNGTASTIGVINSTDGHFATTLGVSYSPLLGGYIFGVGGNMSVDGWVNASSPLGNSDLATKEYVDTATAGLGFEFFLTNLSSDITDYYNLTDTDLGGSESAIWADGLGAGDDQLLFNYSTQIGEPGIIALEQGIYAGHLHMERVSGTRDLQAYWTLSRRYTNNSEELIMTSEVSDLITSATAIDLHAVISSGFDLSTTDRLVFKVYANVGASGNAVNATFYQEGTTDSHVLVRVPSSILTNIFLRQDGTKPLNSNWDAGDYNITLDSVLPRVNVSGLLGNETTGWWKWIFAQNISADNIDAHSDWDNNYDYPAACPANSSVTQIADSTTCTDSWVNAGGDTMSGDLLVSANNTANAGSMTALWNSSFFEEVMIIPDTNVNGLVVYNPGTKEAAIIDQDGNIATTVVGVSDTAGGALHIANSNQTGIALSVYSNQDSSQTASLIALEADNTSFDQALIEATYRGTRRGMIYNTYGTVSTPPAVGNTEGDFVISRNGANGGLLNLYSSQNATAAAPMALLQTTNAAYDMPMLQVYNVGVHHSAWFFRNTASAAQALVFIEEDNDASTKQALLIQQDDVDQPAIEWTAGTIVAEGNTGQTGVATIRDSGGAADCTMTFTDGILTATDCSWA